MSNMSNHTKVLVLNGPNLARLDIRDHSHYGDLNWDQLKNLIQSAAKDLGFEADVRQSDDEAVARWGVRSGNAGTQPVLKQE